MRYTGPAGIHLDADDLNHIMRCLLADSTTRSADLQALIQTHLDALDFAHNVHTHAQALEWIPPSRKPSA